MKFGKIERSNLFFDLFEKGIAPELYSRINYFQTHGFSFPSDHYRKPPKNLKKIYSIKFIPGYFQPELRNKSQYHIRRINQFNKGYAINLDNFNDVDSYVKHQFKNRSKTIRRYVKRLELCFNVSSKMFHGKITTKEYGFLMDTLHKMLVRRFAQRSEGNKRLEEWDRFHKMFFELINKKKASLFVIYDHEKPIMVSLNLHFDRIMFSSISSYDIDYAKFGLGHIDIYKQLEWCLRNNFIIFEMGMGDLDYKRRWSNCIYSFEHHIIYSKDLLGEKITASILTKLYELKEFMKKKKINRVYYTFKSLFYGKVQGGKEFAESELIAEDVPEIPNGPHIGPIDINKDEYSFLRKSVYSFQYNAVEATKDVSLFKMAGNDHSYLIIGKSKKQIISDSTLQ